MLIIVQSYKWLIDLITESMYYITSGLKKLIILHHNIIMIVCKQLISLNCSSFHFVGK